MWQKSGVLLLQEIEQYLIYKYSLPFLLHPSKAAFPYTEFGILNKKQNHTAIHLGQRFFLYEGFDWSAGLSFTPVQLVVIRGGRFFVKLGPPIKKAFKVRDSKSL